MQEDIQIIVIVVVGTLLFVLLAGFIILSLYLYQKSQHKHFKEVSDLESSFQQELLKAQLEMKEQTFQTISQEIHDNIGQVLSLVKLNFNTIDLDNKNELTQKISICKDLVSKAIQDLRSISKSLNSDHIGHHKLSELLLMELELIEKLGALETDFQLLGNEGILDIQKKLIVFRIVQETLNNIVKHANATKICIELQYSVEVIRLAIQDNGIGFDVHHIDSMPVAGKGVGIFNIRNRAKLIGARLTIDSNQHQGTIIQLIIPRHQDYGKR